MEDGSDEPQIPEWAQAYLADYICYRYLSNGNPVKQRQAQFYLNSFLRGMQRLRPQGMGSVTRVQAFMMLRMRGIAGEGVGRLRGLLPVDVVTTSLGEGGRGGKYRMKERRREQR